MTTEELEKKLKISTNTCIHCSTLELAKQVLNIFHQLGLKWRNETHYITYTNWDKYKENTIYFPFNGDFSSLGFAYITSFKILNAEEFIALHTKFDLENYIPKGDLKDFPKEIIARMLDYQEEQGNPRDISVFERVSIAFQRIKGFNWYETQEKCDFWYSVINNKNFNLFFEKYPKKDDLKNYIPKGELEGFPKEIIARMLEIQEEQWGKIEVSIFEKDRTAGEPTKGFVWSKTKEGYDFWNEVIRYKNFALFFTRYPKKEEDSQEFRVGDKVIDIAIRKIGIVKNINLKEIISCQLEVAFENCTTKLYSLEGKYYNDSKVPMLLHYRDDYNYNVIDFNNLPKRQKSKKWRAREGEAYYSFTADFKVEKHIEDNDYFDNNAYDSGNYFQTKKEAQEVADKLNTYFKQLILEQKKEEIKSNVNQEAK